MSNNERVKQPIEAYFDAATQIGGGHVLRFALDIANLEHTSSGGKKYSVSPMGIIYEPAPFDARQVKELRDNKDKAEQYALSLIPARIDDLLNKFHDDQKLSFKATKGMIQIVDYEGKEDSRTGSEQLSPQGCFTLTADKYEIAIWFSTNVKEPRAEGTPATVSESHRKFAKTQCPEADLAVSKLLELGFIPKTRDLEGENQRVTEIAFRNREQEPFGGGERVCVRFPSTA